MQSVTFFLKLAINCKNLFLSLVVVRLVIFFVIDVEYNVLVFVTLVVDVGLFVVAVVVIFGSRNPS